MSRDSNNHESAGTPNHSKSRTRDTLPPPPPPPPNPEMNSNINGQQETIHGYNSKQSPINHVNNIPEQVKQMEPPPPPPPPPSGLTSIYFQIYFNKNFNILLFGLTFEKFWLLRAN